MYMFFFPSLSDNQACLPSSFPTPGVVGGGTFVSPKSPVKWWRDLWHLKVDGFNGMFHSGALGIKKSPFFRNCKELSAISQHWGEGWNLKKTQTPRESKRIWLWYTWCIIMCICIYIDIDLLICLFMYLFFIYRERERDRETDIITQLEIFQEKRVYRRVNSGCIWVILDFLCVCCTRKSWVIGKMVVRLGWYPWGVKKLGCHPKGTTIFPTTEELSESLGSSLWDPGQD